MDFLFMHHSNMKKC